MCNSKKTPEKDEASYLRKIKKPMIEKRRRDRMNRSLDHLKDILLENKENKNQFSKMDKAEILEMSLNLIRELQSQQGGDSISTVAAANAYQRGFKDCAHQTMTYLNTKRSLASSDLSRLDNHLHNFYKEKVFQQTSLQSVKSSEVSNNGNTSNNLRLPNINAVHRAPVQSFHRRDIRCPYVSYDAVVIQESVVKTENILSEETPWRPW